MLNSPKTLSKIETLTVQEFDNYVTRCLLSVMQEQYVFVYDALLEALAVGDTAIPCSVFMQRYTELKRQNPSAGKSQCREEFEVYFASCNN